MVVFLKSGCCLFIIRMCCGFDAPILLPPSFVHACIIDHGLVWASIFVCL
jgi:hypothetical protein